MYDYELSAEQRTAVRNFIESMDDLLHHGVAIIDEQDTGFLCFINGKGVEFDTTGKRMPVLGQISMDIMETDCIECTYNKIIALPPDTVLNVVPPQMKILKHGNEVKE